MALCCSQTFFKFQFCSSHWPSRHVQGAFHGRTYGAMSLTTSKTVYRQTFGPLPSGKLASRGWVPSCCPAVSLQAHVSLHTAAGCMELAIVPLAKVTGAADCEQDSSHALLWPSAPYPLQVWWAPPTPTVCTARRGTRPEAWAMRQVGRASEASSRLLC